jgi:hypothetical protein
LTAVRRATISAFPDGEIGLRWKLDEKIQEIFDGGQPHPSSVIYLGKVVSVPMIDILHTVVLHTSYSGALKVVTGCQLHCET